MKITDLYKPMTLPKDANVDPRYWSDNGDGTYTPTALLIYTIARDATEYFKDKIATLDPEEDAVTEWGNKPIKLGSYHFRDTNVQIVDTYENDMIKREYGLKYKKELDELDKKWKEYQRSHPEEFTITFGVQTVQQFHDENSYINHFKMADLGVSLGEAVAAASAAWNLLDKYKSGGSEFSNLPLNTYDNYRSLKEFAVKHKEIRQKFADELGIPVCVEIEKEKLPTVIGVSEPLFYKKSYTNGTKKPAAGTVKVDNFEEKIKNATPNEETFGQYAEAFIDYITTTTRDQWIKELSENLSKIGTTFDTKFNEKSKLFKLVETADGYEVFTKGDEDHAPEKYITLTKKNDCYECVLKANVDGLDVGFKGTVTDYEDFAKILNIFSKVLETSGVTDLANDLAEVAESL